MVDFHFLNVLLHCLISQHVSKLIGLLCDVLFYSALLDIHMQLLGGLNEKQEVNIPLQQSYSYLRGKEQ